MRFVSSDGRHAFSRIAPMCVIHRRHLVSHILVVLPFRSTRPERHRSGLHCEEGQQRQAITAPTTMDHMMTLGWDGDTQQHAHSQLSFNIPPIK